MDFLKCLAVGAGGFAGAVCRYLLGFLPIAGKTGFPVVTLGINVIGSFAIGMISGMAQQNPNMGEHTLLFLKVGVCGGFTTFSTFALESSQLLQDGKDMMMACYMGASLILCVAGAMAGRMCVK